jgi:hypothetical protein
MTAYSAYKLVSKSQEVRVVEERRSRVVVMLPYSKRPNILGLVLMVLLPLELMHYNREYFFA